ncbi:transglutaminase family protein [Couchioplanes caeruleus]|uniref:transglutaminase family protein n=1 Tax=Couchioplanes caeruleus TaxID=56438 RepID=UPI0020C054BE|nr:transglutaminase family protein [Couchioplanes caeruleus]UQU65606.1 transglutaminase family protein [Couchioplanes caeruleus]
MTSPMTDNWRLKIEHRSGFDYAGPVSSSYHEARMWPRNEARQAVLDAHVEVWPPARTYRYEDYWGTVVTAFDLQAPHETVTVTATSTVETQPPGDLIDDGEGAGWPDLAVPETVDRWYELLRPTPRTGLTDELTAIAADIRGAHSTPHAAALAACEFVRAEVAVRPGPRGAVVATGPADAGGQSAARDVGELRRGACQDISHLTVGLLRAMGVPARYVSGYLHPAPAAAIGDTVAGQSHAWVEWWVGRWTAFDPVNGVPVGERHVVVGRGREHGDVPPLKALYPGPAGSGGTGRAVEVTITRLR